MSTHDIDLHDDDQPVGRLLTRREILRLFGGTGAALALGLGLPRLVSAQAGTDTPTVDPTSTPLPSCVVRPELTEGPYFVDNDLNRSDIRLDPTDESVRVGLPLWLTFRVSEITRRACAPLPGARVDIWHCDAEGEYSGVEANRTENNEALWLRGYQITDEAGVAEFVTIYPGWYTGRAVHIHFKIRMNPEDEQGYEFTSQFFFPEDINDLVHAEAPYASKGTRNRLNEQDGIFRQSEGLLTLDVQPFEKDDESGYAAVFTIGLNLSDASVGADDGAGARGALRPGNPGSRP
ncbi:MAG: hypothetical protein OHK0046_10340 [Anaerolineae bacterium]